MLLIAELYTFIPIVSCSQVFSDGFESGFGSWSGTAAGSGSVTLDSSSPHSGSYEEKVVVSNPGYGAAYYNLPSAQAVTYCRAYYKFVTLPKNNGEELFTLEIYYSSGSYQTTASLYYSSGHLYWTLEIYQNGVETRVTELSPSNPVVGQWYCIEIMRDVSHAQEKLWVDGVSKVNATTSITNNSNAVFVGTGLSTCSAQQTFYVDDVVVANSYIGPISSGVGSPVFSSVSASPVFAGGSCVFSSFWNDNVSLSGYVFSTNNTGVWVNDSLAVFGGTPSWANVTKVLSLTVGQVVGYRWYVNDSSGVWNGTGIKTLIVNSIGGGWLTGWSSRKSHIIQNATGAGTNYQIQIIVINGNGTDYGNTVFLNNKTRIDFGDIRFTNGDGQTVLNYWMQTLNSGINSTFWVQDTDNLSLGNSTIYIYYGNPNVTATSEGTSTFRLFEQGDSWQWINDSSVNPILVPTPGTWDAGGVYPITCVIVNNMYFLYFTGTTSGNVYADGQIGVATSNDGIHWTKFSGNPIIVRTSVSWKGAVTNPAVCYVGGTFYLLYSGYQSDQVTSAAMLATSTDGLHFTDISGNPVLDDGSSWINHHLEVSGLSYFGGYFYFYYNINFNAGVTRNIGVARSSNCINWQKDANNPVVNTSEAGYGTGQHACVIMPKVVKWGTLDGSPMYLMLLGVSSSATSPSQVQLDTLFSSTPWFDSTHFWNPITSGKVFSTSVGVDGATPIQTLDNVGDTVAFNNSLQLIWTSGIDGYCATYIFGGSLIPFENWNRNSETGQWIVSGNMIEDAGAALTFGHATTGGWDQFLGNYIGATKYYFTQNGTVKSISIYCAAQTANTTVAVAIYNDINGTPGILQATSNQINLNTTAQWINFTINVTLTKGYYWISFNTNALFSVYHDIGDSGQIVWIPSNSLKFPSSFGTPVGSSNWETSIYATYITSSPPLDFLQSNLQTDNVRVFANLFAPQNYYYDSCLVARQSGNNFYAIEFRENNQGVGNDIQLWKITNGTFTLLDSTSYVMSNGDLVEFEVSGSSTVMLSGYVNGVLTINYTDYVSPLYSGAIGLGAKVSSANGWLSEFGGIYVTKFVNPEPQNGIWGTEERNSVQ